ncbi:MAG TPA: hypothetical protein VN441_03580, partial [Syntrophomonas sp.]|nr:hypothetical protein [Syntrophomonas sp.]
YFTNKMFVGNSDIGKRQKEIARHLAVCQQMQEKPSGKLCRIDKNEYGIIYLTAKIIRSIMQG